MCDIAKENILKNTENILSHIDNCNEKYHEIKDKYPHICSNDRLFSGIYSLTTDVNYKNCKDDFNSLVETLKNGDK